MGRSYLLVVVKRGFIEGVYHFKKQDPAEDEAGKIALTLSPEDDDLALYELSPGGALLLAKIDDYLPDTGDEGPEDEGDEEEDDGNGGDEDESED